MRIVAESSGSFLVELDDGTDTVYDLVRDEVKPLGPLTREHLLGPGWRPWREDGELERVIVARVAAG